MNKAKNRYHYDVKNCHYCKGVKNEDGTITFGSEVKLLPGLMSIEMSAEGETSKIRADGIDYIVFTSNNGYSGNAKFVMIPEEFRKDCLAETVDEKTGIRYEDADAEPSPFALMGEFKGDKEGIRWIYYNCVASRTKQAGDNKDNQKEPDSEELTLTSSPLPVVIGGEDVSIVRGGVTKSMNETTYNAWFRQVCIPGAEIVAEGTPPEAVPPETGNEHTEEGI